MKSRIFKHIFRKTLILSAILFVPSLIFCEVIVKYVQLDKDSTEIQFLENGKEVARQLVKNNIVVDSSGNIPDGLVKQYYNNGQLTMSVVYKNNVQEGLSKVYNESGNLIKELYYINGKKEGIQKLYYVNGKLQAELPYKADILDGICKMFNEDGSLNNEQNCVKGVKQGEGKIYFSNGKIDKDYFYKDDKLNGIFKSYYDNGRLKQESVYEDDDIVHITRSYKQNGKVNDDDNIPNPKDAGEYIKRGDYNYLQLSNYENAVKDYTAAIKLITEMSQPLKDGYEFIKNDAKLCSHIATCDSICSTVYVKRGNAYLKLNQSNNGIEDYKAAVKLSNNDAALKKLKQLDIKL